MASPQLENGYTKIADEILEVLPKYKFNGSQMRILMVILRYTYGFSRKQHELSLTFISEATGMNRTQVRRELNTLIAKNVILVLKEASFRKPRVIAFNKNYDQWQVERELIRVQGTNSLPVSEKANTQGTNSLPKINNIINNDDDIYAREEKNQKWPGQYERSFALTLNSFVRDKFQEFADAMGDDVVCEAIKRAKDEKARSPNRYCETTLANWLSQGVRSLADIKKLDEKWKGVKSREQKDRGDPGKTKGKFAGLIPTYTDD
jgi:phage replication O-like protein O